MQKPTHIQPIAEKKGPKRIGWATFYDGEVGRRLEALVAKFPQLLDVRCFLPKDRWRILRRLGIVPSKQIAFENITPIVGFAAVTRAMTGNAASLAEIEVNYHALGEDDTEPDDGQTQLGAEGARKLLASLTYADNKAYYTAFYAAAEAVGSWEEMALFINGSETPDSGTMWDRTLQPIVKSSVQTLTVDYEDTFVNA